MRGLGTVIIFGVVMALFSLNRLKRKNEAALRLLWDASLSVYIREKVFDSLTSRHTFREVLLYSDVPCRMSYKKSYLFSSDGKSERLSPLSQMVRLFLPVQYTVPPGARAVIMKDGVRYDFAFSSPARIYSAHQEVDLDVFNEWK